MSDTDRDEGDYMVVRHGNAKKRAKTPSPIIPSKTPSPILPSKTPPPAIKHGAKTQRSQKEKNRGKGKGKATAAAYVSKPITNFLDWDKQLPLT